MAARLNKSVSTITRWCETGKLPAIAKAYGRKTSFLISGKALEVLEIEQEEALKELQISKGEKESVSAIPPSEYADRWKASMEGGLLTGRVFSPVTVRDYLYYFNRFQTKYVDFNLNTFRKALLDVPIEQFGTRFKLYKSLMCFAKFLIQNDCLDANFIEQVKPLYPKRHKPPRRPTVREDDLQRLLEACKSSEDILLITLLSQTGLRASEACAVKLLDIDLNNGFLLVRRGKGGKPRKVGLNPFLVDKITDYLKDTDRLTSWPSDSYLLLDSIEKGLGRFGLAKRLEKIGSRVGVKVSPHALRRAFVTINANKGRPLQMLQMACGHSDIKTTMSYCQTQEKEVIEAMKGWDYE